MPGHCSRLNPRYSASLLSTVHTAYIVFTHTIPDHTAACDKIQGAQSSETGETKPTSSCCRTESYHLTYNRK